MTRFTVPEELFGPLSIKGLEEDRYERLTHAYLPTASIAFLDEIFKANSAILNALLTLLNEREFDNGAFRVKTPLVAVIGASNELPEGEELDALFDRFLLRLHVGPVTKEAFPSLLGLRGQSTPKIEDHLKLTEHELQTVQGAAEAVAVPDDVVALLCDLRDWCTSEKIAVSDRRWRKIVKLLQVSAATNGRSSVSIWDCWLLQYCLWDTPDAREKVFAWYSARVGASAAMDPSRLTTIVVSWEARLRLQAASDGESIAETILIPVRRLEEERLEVRTPHVPAEMRGIERSGEIARMLPVEASMLGHPKLRLVWHARRAERALLTYRVEGIEVERTWAERDALVETQEKRPRPERGPIIAVIDTSGSMHGLPEQVAKAIVLEATRLDLSPGGVARLLAFLGRSFGGGNDESGMMAKVVARLGEEKWRKADVVFVSDGEWPAPTSLLRSVEQAREEGTRFHGIQIGNRGRTGLHAVCDPVHVFQDWAAAGGWR